MPAFTPAYAQISDLTLEFGHSELWSLAPLESDDKNNKLLDEPKLNAMLVDADAIIHNYLSVRYLTPITPVEPILKQVACDLARFRLRNRSGGQSSLTEEVRKRYEDVIKTLEKIRDGKISISASVKVNATPITASVSSYFPPSQVVDTLKGF